jgi:hypothetical protein
VVAVKRKGKHQRLRTSNQNYVPRELHTFPEPCCKPSWDMSYTVLMLMGRRARVLALLCSQLCPMHKLSSQCFYFVIYKMGTRVTSPSLRRITCL